MAGGPWIRTPVLGRGVGGAKKEGKKVKKMMTFDVDSNKTKSREAIVDAVMFSFLNRMLVVIGNWDYKNSLSCHKLDLHTFLCKCYTSIIKHYFFLSKQKIETFVLKFDFLLLPEINYLFCQK